MMNSPHYVNVMNALAQGRRQSDIARDLGISPQRVWTYVQHARVTGELPGPAQTYLYCARMRRFVAFVRTKDVVKTRELFAYYSPYPIQEIGVVRWTEYDERRLMKLAKDSHSHAHWYHATPQLLRELEAFCRSGIYVEPS